MGNAGMARLSSSGSLPVTRRVSWERKTFNQRSWDKHARLNEKAGTTTWKIVPAAKEVEAKLIKEHALNEGARVLPEQKELRALLDDPLGQKFLGSYAKQVHTHETFFVWVDIEEYREIPSSDYRRRKAMHIYNQYIKEGAALELGGIEPAWRNEIKAKLDESEDDCDVIGEDFFDGIKQHAFLGMYHNTFLRFKNSQEYREMKALMKETYNKVDEDDFWYLEQLGEGGFGKVVHVMKKSTDAHLAMKIQLKSAMLDCFSDDPKRIDHERRVLASLHHPFIMGLQYSFQTNCLAILVLEMVTCGDLQEALDKSEGKGLGDPRSAFYTAEIILALMHLHDMGLMYRDLKPCNIMLCQDGHIKVADMGGVAEYAAGTVLEDKENWDRAGTPYSTEIGSLQIRRSFVHDEPTEENRHENEHRRRSIMGTHGYMAPEMVILSRQPRAVRKGYSKSVDYWSLGVTLFKFLTTLRPFDRKLFETFLQDPDCRMGKGFDKYQELLGSVRFPSEVSETAKSLIIGLLQGDERNRLGCTPVLLNALKNHKYFVGIDWAKLALRQVIPPYIPNPRTLNQTPLFPNFSTLIKDYENRDRDRNQESNFKWNQAPKDKDQQYFANWDYISMHTLKVEMGIANEMDELEKNIKLQKIIGETGQPASKPHSNFFNK